jgi:hypothetical protein
MKLTKIYKKKIMFINFNKTKFDCETKYKIIFCFKNISLCIVYLEYKNEKNNM